MSFAFQDNVFILYSQKHFCYPVLLRNKPNPVPSSRYHKSLHIPHYSPDALICCLVYLIISNSSQVLLSAIINTNWDSFLAPPWWVILPSMITLLVKSTALFTQVLQLYEIDLNIIPLLWTRKLRRKVKWPAQSHTASLYPSVKPSSVSLPQKLYP